jgi:malonate decarboxylase delta subunit
VGVVGSGNLEVLIEQQPLDGACAIEISTAAHGFGPIWEAVMRDFHQRWQLADVHVAINDMGATPAVVSLRLDQAAGRSPAHLVAERWRRIMSSYQEATARQRIAGMLDAGSFDEFLPPQMRA